jgi:type VII secretion protein EccB
MAATPTTKAQVQAYRFVLRRMESALVRRDPVMLHDPMRTHLRAAFVGVCVALLVAAGFLIYGFIKPQQELGSTDEIVIGADSGAMFVHLNNPTSRLVPVTNLASARLILIKQSGGGGAAAGVGNAATAVPRQVADEVLKDVPREPLAGIPGAPNDIPDGSELVEPKWTLCDTTIPDPSLPEQARITRPAITTTALIGTDRSGRPLRPDEALLFRASTGEYFLVFDGKRAKVNVQDSAVRQAFDIADTAGGLMRDERRVSVGLLNAIPPAPELRSPIERLGEPSRFAQLRGERVGTVVEVKRVDNRTDYYVILDDGVQQVPKSMADLIRFTVSRGVDFPGVTPEDIANMPKVSRLDVRGFPVEVPSVLPVRDSTVACLYWAYQDGKQQLSITVGDRLTLPGGQRPVRLAQADGSGDRLDEVFLPTGRGAVVQGVVPEQPAGTGTIFLVSDQGVKFGVPSTAQVPSAQLAGALGLGNPQPGPAAVLQLLPTGPALDPDQAIRTFDSVPVQGDAGAKLPLSNGPGAQPQPQQPQPTADGGG